MNYLTTIIVIIVVTFLMRYLLTFAKKQPATNEDGSMVLKYPGFMAVIGYTAIGFGVLIGIITVFQIVPTTGNEVVPYLVSFFVVLGLPLVLIGTFTRITVTDQKVQLTGITGKVKEIRWEEINKVTFRWTAELILHSEHAKVKLNMILIGFNSLVETMKQKLDPALYEKALQEWEKAQQNINRK